MRRIERSPRQRRADVSRARRSTAGAPTPASQRAGEPIAIVGMACRFPGSATDVERFWQLLVRGEDAVGAGSPDELASTPPAGRLEASTRRSLELGDGGAEGGGETGAGGPLARLALRVATEALEDAGATASELSGRRVGTFFAGERVAPSLCAALGFTGPSVGLDGEGDGGAQASLVALALACQSLRARESDLCLVGGARLLDVAPETGATPAPRVPLAPVARSGRCRSYDAAADGWVPGEGCGVVVLKRLRDAERDGDAVRAVVRGWAVAHGGGGAAGSDAHAGLLRAALAHAGLAPEAIELIEGDGSGVPTRDALEVEALRAVYGGRRPEGSRLWLGSVKANVGHLGAAAGIAGLVKATLALERGVVPPTLHWRAHAAPRALEGTGLALAGAGAAFGQPHGAPRRAGVSALGFGGAQAHVLLEAAAPAGARASAGRPRRPFRPASAAPPASAVETPAESSSSLGVPGTSATGAHVARAGAASGGAPVVSSPTPAPVVPRPRGPAVQRWSTTWQRLPPLEGRAATSGRWLVLTPFGGVARAFAGRLEAAGATVTIATGRAGVPLRVATPVPTRREAARASGAGLPALRPGSGDGGGDARRGPDELDEPSLGAAIAVWARRSGGELRGLVLLGFGELVHRAQRPGDAAEGALRAAEALLEACQALEALPPEGRPRLWLVTRGSQRVDGSAVLLDGAAAWGLARSLASEAPHLRCQRVDLPIDGRAGELDELVAEVLCESPEDERALRGGARHAPRVVLEEAPRRDTLSPVRADASYLVAGGLGALGSIAATRLVDDGARHLVLLGRRGADTPARREAVAALERRGVTVTVARADVTRPEQVAAALKELGPRLPPLRGVVHAAAVQCEGYLTRLSREQLRAALAPRVLGSLVLQEATCDRPVELFACVASAASVLGAPGQGADAAGGAFLDAFACSRRALGFVAQSLHLGPVAGPGDEGAQERPPERPLQGSAPPLGGGGLARLERDVAGAALGAAWREAWLERTTLAVDADVLADDWPEVARAPRFGLLLAGALAASRRRTRRGGGAASGSGVVESASPAPAAAWLHRPLANAGARVRLVCFPDAGCGPEQFDGWSAALPEEIEVLVAHYPARGARGGEAAAAGIDALAEGVLGAVAPLLDKPLAVFGHGLGALVMFEFLLRLHERHGVQALQVFPSGAAAPERFWAPKAAWRSPAELERMMGIMDVGACEGTGAGPRPSAALVADLELAARYVYRNSATLEAAASVFAGVDDLRAPQALAALWRWHFRGPFAVHLLPGRHGFLRTCGERVLSLVAGELLARLAEVEQAGRDRAVEPWLLTTAPRPGARVRLAYFPGLAPEAPPGFAAALGDGVELTTVLAPGRGARAGELPLARVDAYVEQLMPRFLASLDRPTAFVGVDLGALVAYELARRLCRRRSDAPMHLFVVGAEAPQRFFFPAVAGRPLSLLRGQAQLAGLELDPSLSERALRAGCAALAGYTAEQDSARLTMPVTAFVQGERLSSSNVAAWGELTSRSFATVALPGEGSLGPDAWEAIAGAVRVGS